MFMWVGLPWYMYVQFRMSDSLIFSELITSVLVRERLG